MVFSRDPTNNNFLTDSLAFLTAQRPTHASKFLDFSEILENQPDKAKQAKGEVHKIVSRRWPVYFF
jgi:hypothetical protein